MLFPELLVDRKFFLGEVFLSGANVSLPKAVAHVRQLWIEFSSRLVFRNRISKLGLVGVEIAQLQMRLGGLRVQGQGFLQECFDLVEVQSGILGSLALPQTHGVVIMRLGV